MSYDDPTAAVAKGLFAFLRANAELMALVQGVFNADAPFRSGYPICSFGYYAGKSDDTSFTERVRTPMLYKIKGISLDDGGVIAGQISGKLDEILWDAALPLDGTGWKLMRCRGQGEPISYPFPLGGHTYYHRGRTFHINLTPAD